MVHQYSSQHPLVIPDLDEQKGKFIGSNKMTEPEETVCGYGNSIFREDFAAFLGKLAMPQNLRKLLVVAKKQYN